MWIMVSGPYTSGTGPGGRTGPDERAAGKPVYRDLADIPPG